MAICQQVKHYYELLLGTTRVVPVVLNTVLILSIVMNCLLGRQGGVDIYMCLPFSC